jgi:hypothetical protein
MRETLGVLSGKHLSEKKPSILGGDLGCGRCGQEESCLSTYSWVTLPRRRDMALFDIRDRCNVTSGKSTMRRGHGSIFRGPLVGSGV